MLTITLLGTAATMPLPDRALTAAVVWGWAYPLIKLGFKEFAITPEMTGSKFVYRE